MLPPMRPNPIIASCIAAPPSDGHGQRREIPAQLWGVVIQNRVHPEPPCGLEVVFAIVDECRRRRFGLRHHQGTRSEEHTSELQSPCNLVCRLLLEKKKNRTMSRILFCIRIQVYA